MSLAQPGSGLLVAPLYRQYCSEHAGVLFCGVLSLLYSSQTVWTKVIYICTPYLLNKRLYWTKSVFLKNLCRGSISISFFTQGEKDRTRNPTILYLIFKKKAFQRFFLLYKIILIFRPVHFYMLLIITVCECEWSYQMRASNSKIFTNLSGRMQHTCVALLQWT